MGLFDDFFGADSDQDQVTAGTQKTDTQTKQAQVEAGKTLQTNEQQTTQELAQTGTTRLLDPESEAALKQIFLQLSETLQAGEGNILPEEVKAGSNQLLELSTFLTDRAKATEGLVAEQSGAILGEARRQGENALESNQTRLAEGAGSNLNSIVQASGAQGRADLESQLAALAGDLAIRGRQLGSQDLTTAFGASAEGVRTSADVALAGSRSGVENLGSIATILKGVTTEQDLSQLVTGEVSEQSEINQLLEALSELTTRSDVATTGTATGSGTQTPGVIPGIVDLFRGFGDES